VCMWLLVVIGAVLDWLLKYAGEQLGFDIKLNFLVAAVVAIWLICNEIISILENISDIGVKLPPLLIKLTQNIKSKAEEAEK
ncbi:MAG TPA: phage holin family protein, partial [Clostridia bacterium]|nr:phage holin family protein [Clostridia bacterium]